jgi:hypothetical protein
MKLLFSTNPEKASEELKELLGYVDADLNFKNLKSDVKTATREIIDIIGKEVYDHVADLYDEDNTEDDYSEEEWELLQSVRLPIAVNAYRLYVPSNDLAQTNDGRKMRNEDNEKSAFEWMIDRDNKEQEKRYYRALDDLIYFLDDSKIDVETETTIFTIWTSSDKYKESQKLFIRSTKDFREFYPIESRYLLMMLNPGIAFCENREILSRVGLVKFNDLKTKLKDNTEISDAKDLKLISLIKEACVNYSLAWAIPRMSVQILPEGILQAFTSERMTSKATRPSMLSEPEAARQAFTATYARVVADIEDLLKPPPASLDDIEINPAINYGDKHFSAT